MGHGWLEERVPVLGLHNQRRRRRIEDEDGYRETEPHCERWNSIGSVVDQ